ncbi:MAG: putative transporter ATP-binding protein [Subtercola sp.]|nr:putative transporter ATP-binding protein [Subtercola sp.]
MQRTPTRRVLDSPVDEISGGRPLTSSELGTAAVLAGVAALLVAVGSLVPHVGAIGMLATIPLAVIGQRHRARAVVAAAVAGCTVAFLVAGISSAVALIVWAVVGGLVGSTVRRGRGAKTIIGVSLLAGPVFGLAAVSILLVFSAARDLAFASVAATVHGVTVFLHSLGLVSVASFIDAALAVTLASWWLVILVGALIGTPLVMLLVWRILSTVLRRLDWIVVDDPFFDITPTESGEPIADPLLIELSGVEFRYAGAAENALRGLDLVLDRPEFIVVSGRNGSGKSTLMRLLAGASATRGEIRRNRPVALGAPGGTAIIMQRPESQILGMTVAEDVRWGVRSDASIDIEATLSDVGLAGMRDRPTSSLSGGQLQRLALAAALVRRPMLLISDESTAMVDAAGRCELIDVLRHLPESNITVIHVTHSDDEVLYADRHIRLADGRIIFDERQPGMPRENTRIPKAGWNGNPALRDPDARPLLALENVSHTYDAGTPWQQRTLHRVSVELHEAEGLLITGENGGGKSTIAWIMAGLIIPTDGRILLDGEPVTAVRGSVAMAFQHPRLQLQRPTVREDILAASGRRGSGHANDIFVRDALSAVGLPPELAARSIDALSGGQMRRVALAGLIASRPRALILDEPFAGLDRESRRQLAELLARLRDQRRLAIVLISHDLDETDIVCSRTVRLADGVLS